MEARKDHVATSKTTKPFDWTFTSEYAGTLGPDVRIEETDLKIDMEKLKRRDPIFFYTQLTMYEDELADHGCSLVWFINFSIGKYTNYTPVISTVF